MKLLLEIPNNKANFALELLKSLRFKVKPLTDYKAQVLEDLRDAVEEVNLAKRGKIKLKSAEKLLDEL